MKEMEIKDRGSSPVDFLKGNVPVEKTPDDKDIIKTIKKKKFVPVVIEIRIDAPVPMTRLEHRINLWVDDTKLFDNTALMKSYMEKFTSEIGTLVERWTKEVTQLKI